MESDSETAAGNRPDQKISADSRPETGMGLFRPALSQEYLERFHQNRTEPNLSDGRDGPLSARKNVLSVKTIQNIETHHAQHRVIPY